MAIAAMSHIRLVGLRREQNRILGVLTSRGLFEVRTADAVTSGLAFCETKRYRELKLKQGEVAFALEFLKARHLFMAGVLKSNAADVKRGRAQAIDYTLSGENYGDGRRLITKADFSDAAAREYELLHVCDALKKISFALVECAARTAELCSEAEEYKPYAAAPIRLSELKRDGDIEISLYSCKTSYSPEKDLNELPCAYEIIRDGGIITVIAVAREKNAETVDKRMTALGYTKCVYFDECTAREKISALESEKADISRRIAELTKTALEYEKHVGDLRILYDVIGLDIERAEAEQRLLNTDSTFVLEGWLPERIAEKTANEVRSECPSAFIQLLAPEEKDAPPTLVENNAIVTPYEQITNMYSAPHYREIDPNPIMAIFYFLFFGIMVGDAAYGIILAVLGFAIGRSKKFDTGVKNMALLIGMGGISAIVWGVVFGGYFSINFGTDIALWFNPLEDPLTMLVFSLVLGCVQLSVGYVVKFISLCKDGDVLGAIADAGSILLLFAALGCFGANMVIVSPSSALVTTAIALAGCGAGLILVFGGRKSKNVFGKITGGIGGLYGIINLLSDVLSYCRLFGLCLASCAVGLAFNTLGGMLFAIPVVGYPIGIILLVPLHAFNLGIGVLGAYVHDARLQFLEFYGKFYKGEGKLFSPLGVKTKYIRFS